MKPSHPRFHHPRVAVLLAFSLGVLAFAATANAQAPAAAPGSMVEAIARQLGAEYERQQVKRLAEKGDRDSLVAAALIGMPNRGSDTPEGHAEVLERLASKHDDDALALYVAALACNFQSRACDRPQYQARLLAVAPSNPIHHLLLPSGQSLDAARLQQAAAAGKSDSHFTELLGIVHRALADQPALASAAASADADALAQAMRRNELAALPWPNLAPVAALCSAAAAATAPADSPLRTDCPTLGLSLFGDAGGSVVTQSYGGTFIRRFVPDSVAAAEAVAFRRQVVWLDGQPAPSTPAQREAFSDDLVKVGEWEALQRHAERLGSTRLPDDAWTPADASLLLLPEQRAGTP